jgi:23S rRNA pseudouridine2605 synthase
MPAERLQKILANAGVTSRRKAEEMIVEGRVTVNGAVIVELGSKADLDKDHIKVDGKLLRPARRLAYYAMNKPREVVTTLDDPQGRKTVIDLLRGVKERVYPVGRLDYHSEGLLLLTNDGDFANAIMAPARHVPKMYMVKANGVLTSEQELQFRDGIPLDGRRTAPARIKRTRYASNPWYEVEIIEGRQNQIRKMFKALGLLVEKLRRTRIAFLELGTLKPGTFRELTPQELKRFRRILQLEERE